MMIYIVFLIYVVSCALGMVLVKYGGRFSTFQISMCSINFNVSWIFLVGILLYGISFILWMYIIQKFQLTYISPIGYGLSFITMAVLSYLFLQESMTVPQIIGTVMIIAGVFISSVGAK